MRDIRANDATQYERARFSRELGVIFNIRYQIYKKKFFIKFLNNFMAQLGPFFFFSIGGYLVITGDLTLGALVAVVGAHKELYSPWKELLNHYQLTWDSQIKFEQVVAQFDPAGLRDEALQSADPTEAVPLTGMLRGSQSDARSRGRPAASSTASASPSSCRRGSRIVGPAGSGKEELTLVLANLLDPNAGRVLIDDRRGAQAARGGHRAADHLCRLSGADLRRHDRRQSVLRAAPSPGAAARARRARRPRSTSASATRRSARAIRRSTARPTGSTTRAAGLSGPEEIVPAAVRALTMVRLDRDVYQMGLRGTIDPEAQPEVAAAFLEARRAMRERLEDPRFGRLVEVFDPERYNTNATLAENLLFGAPVGETFDIDHLAAHPYVQQILDRAGLTDALVEVGFKLAATMVELFADLPPDHEYFRQFSFISADDLPDYRALTSRVDPSRLDTLSPEDRQRLIALTFKLVPARHRLDLIDEALQARVLEARRLFREQLPAELAGQRRVLRRRPLHRRGEPAGQHPVRQDRLRPGAGDRADQRADRRGAGRARPARAGGRGRPAGARPGSAAAGCRWRSARSWRSPARCSSAPRS